MTTRPTLLLMICSAVLGAVSAMAQESAPASRTNDSRRFHKITELPPIVGTGIIAQAMAGGATITVLAEGVVFYSDGKANYEARLPTSACDRIKEFVSAAKAREKQPSLSELSDLVRLPSWIGGFQVEWPPRHQEPDGSWSPSAFDWYCDEGRPPVCTGSGKGSFGVAATALICLNYLNAGFAYRTGQMYMDVLAEKAIDYLLTRQRPDGGFAGATEPAWAMTNACAAIVLCRAAVAAKKSEGDSRPASEVETQPWLARRSPPEQLHQRAGLAIRRLLKDQNADGSWGKDADETRRLSTAVWNLLALRAGATAGIESDPAIARRGLAWIEKTVAGIEERWEKNAGPATLPRALASRAVARAAGGSDAAELEDDVNFLAQRFEEGGAPVLDAETILFWALAAQRCRGTIADMGTGRFRALMFDTQVRDGCAEGSWDTPCVWSDLGGRLASTAMMTWALEVYYRYPLAVWLE